MGSPILSGEAGAGLAIGLSHAVVTLLLVVALLAARDARGSVQGRLLVLLALSLAALELATGPNGPTGPLKTVLRLAGASNLALFWLFCLSILRDDFRMRPAEWVGSVLLVVGPLLVILGGGGAATGPLLEAFSAAAPFAMIVHVAWVAISERSGDLVDARRRARLWIPLALAFAALTSVLSEEVADPAAASLIRNGLAGLPISLVLLWWLARIDPMRLRFETPAAAPKVDPRDQALLAELLALVDRGGLYREPELTIEALATRLGTPTHRLRALINGGLGFRNFAAFINGYRLDHAKAALADPRRGRETILPIAFEAGFNSLQTFNRVFRQTEGVTPTAFRAQALGTPAHEEKSLPVS